MSLNIEALWLFPVALMYQIVMFILFMLFIFYINIYFIFNNYNKAKHKF